MTVKYITASLLSVRRIFGPLRISRSIGLKICACTTTNTKTAMSKGAGREFCSRNVRIRKNDKLLTKDEIEGCLGDYPSPPSVRIARTQLIQTQRDRSGRS